MNIAVLNAQIPLCTGGAEVLAEDLIDALKARGHNPALVTVPFKWYPQQSLIDSMLACKLLDISEFNGVKIDKVIALKFPMWLIEHENMSLWILHQHRSAYELWDTKYNDLASMPDGHRVRDLIQREDCRAIAPREKVFTISQNVTERLQKYNGIGSGVLYPPPRAMGEFYCKDYGDFLFFPSRITPLKRQELVIEALAYAGPAVKVVFAGQADDETYLAKLQSRALELGVDSRITWLGHISEQQKFDLYAECRMVLFPAYNEDYGYITPEAMLSHKGVLTLDDSGGALEFVVDGENGSVARPDAQALGEAMDSVYSSTGLARRYGDSARARIDSMDISWDTVVDSLL